MTLQPKGGAEQDNLASVPVVLHPHVFLRASGTSEIGLECYDAADATAALDTDTQKTKRQKHIEYLVNRRNLAWLLLTFFCIFLSSKLKINTKFHIFQKIGYFPSSLLSQFILRFLTAFN